MTIHETDQFRVVSILGRRAFNIIRRDGASFWVQDDAANDFYHSVFEQDVVTVDNAIEFLYGKLFV